MAPAEAIPALPHARRSRSGYDVGLNVAAGFGDRIMIYSEVPSNAGLVSKVEHAIEPGQRWTESRLGTRVRQGREGLHLTRHPKPPR